MTMQKSLDWQQQLDQRGYAILPAMFGNDAVESITSCIENADKSKEIFRQSGGLYAIRNLMLELPQLSNLIFTEGLKKLLHEVFEENCLLIKSIYFDKPAGSNWYVAWHQDLSINLKAKCEEEGFSHWTQKHGIVGVQPPISILESILTIRIHLDDTDGENGALRVLPCSHHRGIERPELIADKAEKEAICNVPAGGIMLMRPLLQHRSQRSQSERRRRVIHLEFCNATLPEGMDWMEGMWVLGG